MKKTYELLFEFVNTSANWLEKNPGESKQKYAIEKVNKRAEKAFQKYNEKVVDLGIKFCSVDDKKNIIKDANKELVFTQENLLARNKAIRELMQEEADIEPYIVEAPENLTEDQIEAFTGLII
jgi:rhamnose utilization protein RhaD (predicted bifunctional aldolase and dehydrogenase)